MGFFIILLIIVGFFYMFSKSTSYGPKGFMGGYSETQMGNDIVCFVLQTLPLKRVINFSLLWNQELGTKDIRQAELTAPFPLIPPAI